MLLFVPPPESETDAENVSLFLPPPPSSLLLSIGIRNKKPQSPPSTPTTAARTVPAHECVDRAASIFSLYFSPFGIAAAGPCCRPPPPPPPPPSRAKSSIFRAHLSTGDVQPRVLGTEDGVRDSPIALHFTKKM